jgi:hypothetical protein
VRAKNGYWYSEAGGVSRYFGRVVAISHSEAMSRLWAALANNASVDRWWGQWAGRRCSERTNSMPASSPKLAFARSFVPSQVHSAQLQRGHDVIYCTYLIVFEAGPYLFDLCLRGLIAPSWSVVFSPSQPGVTDPDLDPHRPGRSGTIEERHAGRDRLEPRAMPSPPIRRHP